jgi:hypothetical protein
MSAEGSFVLRQAWRKIIVDGEQAPEMLSEGSHPAGAP